MVIVVAIAIGLGFVIGGYGWLMAHTRQTPIREVDDLGPIDRAFPIPPTQLAEAVRRQAETMRSVKLIDWGPSGGRLSVRPSARRLDDAMGLFVTVTFAESSGQGWYRITGQSKSWVGTQISSQMALKGFERELRMGLKDRQGLAAIGSHSAM